MPSKMVGAESAALSASRMSRERSAGELHSQFENGAGERKRTVVSALARPSRTAGLLNHTRKKIGVPSWTLTGNLTLRTRPLYKLSYGDENWYARPVTLRNPTLI